MAKHLLLCDSEYYFPNNMRAQSIMLPTRISEIWTYLEDIPFKYSGMSEEEKEKDIIRRSIKIFCKEIKGHINDDSLRCAIIVFPEAAAMCRQSKKFNKPFKKMLKMIRKRSDVSILSFFERTNENAQKLLPENMVTVLHPAEDDPMAFSKNFHQYLASNDLYQ